jgi:hypothetical protein
MKNKRHRRIDLTVYMKGKESPRKKGNKKKNEQRRIYANRRTKNPKERINQDIFSLLLIIPGLGKPSSSHVGSFFFPPQGLHIFVCLVGSSKVTNNMSKSKKDTKQKWKFLQVWHMVHQCTGFEKN